MNTSKSRKSIAIVHPDIKGGGGEAVLAWTLEALKRDYRLTVITIDNVDVSFFNNFYGTSLSQDEFSVSRICPFLARFPHTLYLFRRHLVMRYCKAIKEEYDMFFSTQNELDFGVRGMQYIHFPVHADELMRELNQLPKHRFYKDSYLRNLYKYVCIRLSNFDKAGIGQNVTLVNSDWTGNLVKGVYNIQNTTVYPPVFFNNPVLAWGDRENGFISIGWIIPQKNFDKIINVLSAVRNNGFDIHLHIIGPVRDKAYAAQILRLCELNQEWLFFEGLISRSDLVNFIARHRFAIHGMEHEHFGIAVAEAAKGGCIVFIPNGGGQREIVDFDYRVIYQDEEDAVKKIITILRDRHVQEMLSSEMLLRSALFSPEYFMDRVRSLVKDII